ncbi:MAG: site-2 protease family protein [Spirochaetes bacterium]|nr:site-2 protease family protein [Spirochaetota bacterium]
MNYLWVLFILGTLILIHELGHFLAARAAGIPVELFSIGFGPALIKKSMGATEYRISLIPLGGYVLPAVRDQDDYFHIPIWKRIAFALGGPAANLIATLVLFAILNIIHSGFTSTGVLVEPFRQTADIIRRIMLSLSELFTGNGSIMGIAGILHQGGKYIGEDGTNAIKLALMLSANLAVFNMLPLPVLDGGKIILCLLERISVRLRAAYLPIMIFGWLLVIGVMVYATVMDAGRLLLSYS